MEMLERFGLAGDAHKETGDLSLGNQKLVEVCRALVAEPRVVLLDEPAAGLGADDVRVLLRGLREVVEEQSLCLVIIEHDLELVTTLCPEISVLHFGRIISQGSPAHVTSDPVVVEAYLGHGFELSEADTSEATSEA
jgi:branched-chain amino acid transport system ATP-binding protein